jgi:hypothetical protein
MFGCYWGLLGISIPPVTTEHGDEAVFNFLCPAKQVDSLWSESTPQKKSKSSMQPKKQRKNYQKYSQQFLEAARRTLDKNTNEGHLPHEAYALFFVCSRSFHPQLVFVLVNVCVCVFGCCSRLLGVSILL